MIGRDHFQEEFARVAVQLTMNFRWELVVLLAERCDPSLEWERCPVDQMIREAD